MNDLDTQIRIEAETLCKAIRDYFNVNLVDEGGIEYRAVNSIVYRLEQLLHESKKQWNK